MHKITVLLAASALVLAGACGAVVWHLTHPREPILTPEAVGDSIHLGVAGIATSPNPAKLVNATSAVVWNGATGKIQYEQNSFERVPIASLTKLMTAMVALDYGMPWETMASIEPREYVYGGKLLLQPGEEVRVRDLFHASLIGSANNATLAYVRVLGVPESEFVQAMNRKAVALGLEQTYFVEVTGLDPENISTAYDVARLAHYAFNQYPEIGAATRANEYAFTIGGSGREHTIKNTNKLVSEQGQQLAGSKTGYLYESGYCLVVQGVGQFDNHIAVILGSPSEPQHFTDIQTLLNTAQP